VITAPTDTVFQNRTPRFEFTGGATYQCRLGNTEFAPCDSGVTYGPLDDGDYRFEVRAIAADGTPQEGATPFYFTVDNEVPDPPTIDEPMDGAVIARRTVMLRGATEDFTEVEVYDGATKLGNAQIENEGTGDWKFEPMEPLAAGEAVPLRPSGAQLPPAGIGPDPGSRPAPGRTRELASNAESSFGALALRVQPSDATVTIDGERSEGSPEGDRLVVELGAGVHQIELRKDGYRGYLTDVTVRGGETTTLNVAMTPNR